MMIAFEDPRMLIYEPSPAGALDARQAVSAYYSARGVGVRAERILLTASTSEAYAYLFKLLADPGDHVLVPRPSYPLFEFLANMESVEARRIRWSITEAGASTWMRSPGPSMTAHAPWCW